MNSHSDYIHSGEMAETGKPKGKTSSTYRIHSTKEKKP